MKLPNLGLQAFIPLLVAGLFAAFVLFFSSSQKEKQPEQPVETAVQTASFTPYAKVRETITISSTGFSYAAVNNKVTISMAKQPLSILFV